ncbi:hypothetical protein [Streptomyces blattellae]|uniref:hypothetical protein n=1 Tax=Streptomyces blattellae TaxID=2569855 RepID=UPI0018ACC5B5
MLVLVVAVVVVEFDGRRRLDSPRAMDFAVFDTALIPRYAVVMLLTAVNAAVSTPTITALSPSSCRTPKIATPEIARLLMITASSPYRARRSSSSSSGMA